MPNVATKLPAPLEAPPKPLLKRLLSALTVLLWGVAALYFSGFLVGAVTTILNLNPSSTLTELIFTLIVYLLALALTLYLPGKLKKSLKSSRTGLGLSGLPTWLDILLALAGLVLSLLLFYCFSQLFVSLFSWYDPLEAQDVGFHGLYSSTDRILAFLALVVAAPIAEEILFRGWIYGRVRNYLPKLPAILLVSLAFGALHGQWNAALATFILSLVLCSGREITGTIYAGIILHMLYNTLGFAANFM